MLYLRVIIILVLVVVVVAIVIIIIIIRFHRLSKQSAFIAQLVAIHEFVLSVLEDLQRWSINDLLWQQIPAVHNSLAEETHSALFQ